MIVRVAVKFINFHNIVFFFIFQRTRKVGRNGSTVEATMTSAEEGFVNLRSVFPRRPINLMPLTTRITPVVGDGSSVLPHLIESNPSTATVAQNTRSIVHQSIQHRFAAHVNATRCEPRSSSIIVKHFMVDQPSLRNNDNEVESSPVIFQHLTHDMSAPSSSSTLVVGPTKPLKVRKGGRKYYHVDSETESTDEDEEFMTEYGESRFKIKKVRRKDEYEIEAIVGHKDSTQMKVSPGETLAAGTWYRCIYATPSDLAIRPDNIWEAVKQGLLYDVHQTDVPPDVLGDYAFIQNNPNYKPSKSKLEYFRLLNLSRFRGGHGGRPVKFSFNLDKLEVKSLPAQLLESLPANHLAHKYFTVVKDVFNLFQKDKKILPNGKTLGYALNNN